jgi:hypothetical protein
MIHDFLQTKYKYLVEVIVFSNINLSSRNKLLPYL